MPMKKSLALYIHIPFCKVKCTYCDFYSVKGRETEIPNFINTLLLEINATFRHFDTDDYEISSLFFGGGTPGLFKASHIKTILDAFKREISFAKDTEITIEANPGETSQKTFVGYLQAGVNRLSMGAQSFNDANLKFMTRIHDAKQISESYRDARMAGFNNINLDLIFGLPNQTLEDWTNDLDKITSLNPEHISAYSLTVEEGTALHRWVQNGHVELMEDLKDLEMFHFTKEFLAKYGYSKYEISNYTKDGFECRHNLHYWLNRPYLSFGPAAHSYFNQQRWANVRNLSLWQSDIHNHQFAFIKTENIDMTKAKNEMIFTRLRLLQGLDLSEFNSAFKDDFLQSFDMTIKKWLPNFIKIDNNCLKLTDLGFEIADEITSDFMLEED
jgi:oxygen-independent coproporphyrinogen III oxidase